MEKTLATYHRVNELLRYDQATGELRWNVSRGKAKAHAIAGVRWTTQNKTYIVVTIDSRQYFAHRVAWLLVKGEWPKHNIDHRNGNGIDNRIENLRDVPQRQNNKNKRPKVATEKQWGVRFNQGQWQAQIRVDGVVRYLGGFRERHDAIAARKRAEVIYGFDANHGVAISKVNQ